MKGILIPQICKTQSLKYILVFSCITIFLSSCTNDQQANNNHKQHSSVEINKQENASFYSEDESSTKEDLSIQKAVFNSIGEIPLPKKFTRIETTDVPFLSYLRSVGINNSDDIVHLYNGKEKNNQNVHFAILDLDVGTRDLQQCADAVMRLRGEYLFEQKRYDDISFLFTNGDRVYFKQYAKGFRPAIKGNHVEWSKKADEDYSYASFRKYMDLIFTYAGTLSLSKELDPVSNFENILPGDVIIIGGSPGHAVIIVDMAKHDETGEKIFMIAQSYMPAQEIHILKNLDPNSKSPWYAIPNSEEFDTPEYFFSKNNLMRFSTP